MEWINLGINLSAGLLILFLTGVGMRISLVSDKKLVFVDKLNLLINSIVSIAVALILMFNVSLEMVENIRVTNLFVLFYLDLVMFIANLLFVMMPGKRRR
ncbi:hypothetical protein ACFL2R_03370 [Patescibacteria group bacterium]